MTKPTKARKPRVGRRRWAKLVRFLEQTMESSGSERLRMTAALRLADVLTLREQRELAEIRAAARVEAKAEGIETVVVEPDSGPDAEQATDESIASAFAFLDSRPDVTG